MGFFDKLKNAVTGGSAKVELEIAKDTLALGETIMVKVNVHSTGSEVKSKGVFVDLWGEETVRYKDHENKDKESSTNTMHQELQIAPALVLAAGEAKQFQGQITIPASAFPSYAGKTAT